MFFIRINPALILLLAATAPAARAKDLFVVNASGVANVTVAGNSLPGLITDAVSARGAFASLGNESATIRLNYAGVVDAVRVDIVTPPGGIGTYTATLRLPGYIRTFTGTGKANLREQLVEFLRIDNTGHGDIIKSLKKIYASTQVTITDGTPQSSTALVADREFSEFGLRHGRTREERAALDAGERLDIYGFSVEAGVGTFGTRGGYQGTVYTVAPTLRLGERYGFVFSLPFRFVDVQGAAAGEAGLLMGVPLQLISEDKDSRLSWQVTPFVHATVAGSFDMLQAAIDLGGGVTHRIGYNFGFCTLQIANQIGYYDGIDIAGYDIGVEQQILKNGLQLSVPLTASFLLELRATRTDFLQDAAVPLYYTFGADLVFRTRGTREWYYVPFPDDFVIGVAYDTDLKGYSSPQARTSVRWRW